MDLSCRGPVVSPLPQVEETMRWKCAGTFDSCRPVTGIEGNMAGLSARAGQCPEGCQVILSVLCKVGNAYYSTTSV